MSTDKPPTYDDVTIDLIESISAICRALRTRPLKSSAVRNALEELRRCPDLGHVLQVRGLPPAPSPCSPLEPPLTPTPAPPSTPTVGTNADPRVRTLAKQPALFGTQESLPVPVEKVVRHWNLCFSLPRVNTLGKRLPLVQKALLDEFWAENWQKALKRLLRTPFCMGKNRRKWKADFEWFCDPVNVDRLLSGKYDNISETSEPPNYERTEI